LLLKLQPELPGESFGECDAIRARDTEQLLSGPLDRPADAIVAGERLLKLAPPDPTEVHFELAELMADNSPDTARAYVVQALEEAPRYRAALQLLLEINRKSPQPKADADGKTGVEP
jgi:hypothetical protein